MVMHGKILIIDDDDLWRRHLRQQLENSKHEVFEATDGEQGIEFAKRHPVDLILLDNKMSGMWGKEVLEELQRDARLREVPVLMVTGTDPNIGTKAEQIAEFLTMGADDYLCKDDNPKVMDARITNCLKRKFSQDQLKEKRTELKKEQNRTGKLLEALLPKLVADKISEGDTEFGPQPCRNSAVMFCDIVSFTSYCENNPIQEVIGKLRRLVGDFEGLCKTHDLVKIKTIGDSFMATSGMLNNTENPVLNCVRCAERMRTIAEECAPDWRLRIGIDFGSYFAGTVGKERFQFDIWGRTVNMAARIESEGEDEEINLSEAAWSEIADIASGRVIARNLKGIGDRVPIYIFTNWSDS